MSHAFKTFLKIIHKRIFDKYEKKSGDTQFDFKNSLRERGTVLYATTRTKMLRPMKECKYLCALLIDKKTYNNLLILILQEINEKNIRIIHKLYYYQTARFRFNHTSQTSNIRITEEDKDAYAHHFYLISMWRRYFSWYLKTMQQE